MKRFKNLMDKLPISTTLPFKKVSGVFRFFINHWRMNHNIVTKTQLGRAFKPFKAILFHQSRSTPIQTPLIMVSRFWSDSHAQFSHIFQKFPSFLSCFTFKRFVVQFLVLQQIKSWLECNRSYTTQINLKLQPAFCGRLLIVNCLKKVSK